MESPIDRHRELLVGVCQRHRSSRLDLVGSAARGDFNPVTSDLDFLGEFLELEDATVRNPFLVRSLDRHRGVLHAA